MVFPVPVAGGLRVFLMTIRVSGTVRSLASSASASSQSSKSWPSS